jgi:dephospho-CoA kinase
LPQDERVTHADVVIDNDGDLDKLRERVETVWRERAQA